MRRLRVERELAKTLSLLLKSDAKVKSAVEDFEGKKSEGCKIVDLQLEKIRRDILRVQNERKKLDVRIDYLLELGKLVKMQKYLKTSQSEIIEHLIGELWKEVSQEAKTKRKRLRKRKSS